MLVDVWRQACGVASFDAGGKAFDAWLGWTAPACHSRCDDREKIGTYYQRPRSLLTPFPRQVGRVRSRYQPVYMQELATGSIASFDHLRPWKEAMLGIVSDGGYLVSKAERG